MVMGKAVFPYDWRGMITQCRISLEKLLVKVLDEEDAFCFRRIPTLLEELQSFSYLER